MGEIREYFKVYPAGIPHDRFVHVTKKLVGLPSFFNAPLVARINALYGTASDAAAAAAGGGRTRGGALLSAAAPATTGAGSSSSSTVTLASFVQYWKNEVSPFDRVTRFFRAVKRPEAECVTKDDLIPFLQELLHYHPGLEFLEGSDEFQLKYALSVVARIFFQVNRSGSGRLSLSEVCRSNLYAAFMHVDEENDINRVTEYFSYEHFYVLYCRFFELDADRNGLLSREDLIRYSEHALSEQIVDRVFQEGRRAFSDGQRGFADVPGMGFGDFCFFMLSEEDKTSEASLRYWFHCCDLDGDGVLSTEELRHFYRGQLHRMSSLGVECVPFQDVLCQLIDLIDPADSQALTLRDLLRADKRMQSGLLFDVLFNLNKFLRFEQRDPFQEKLRREDGFASDWDRFAFLDYQRLSSEDQDPGGSARLDGDMEIDQGIGHGDGGYGRCGGGQSYMQQPMDAGATLGGRSQWLDDSDEDDDDGFGDGGAGGGGVQLVYLARGGLAGRGRR
jgi:serine/threonine-protein phosphatase 2A regulatory subunit B''